MNFFNRLDPRTIFFIFPCALTCAFLLSREMLRDGCFLLFLFTVLAVLKRWGTVLVWAAILCLAHMPLVVFQEPSFQSLFFALSVRKIAMVFCTGTIIFTSVSISDCIQVMKKMMFPKNIIIPLAVCFRLLPTLVFEAGIIRDAMKVRRLYTTKRILRHPLATFEIFLSTLLYRVFALGEELVFSLSTRGLSFKGGGSYREIGFSWRDWCFMALTALYVFFVLYSPLPEIKV